MQQGQIDALDFIAISAMAAILSSEYLMKYISSAVELDKTPALDFVASSAYEYAEAMVAERQRRKGKAGL